MLVVAHKVVSKAEGRVRRLATSSRASGPRARRRAGEGPARGSGGAGRDGGGAAGERGVLICVTHHGLVCANAGVDASNAGRARTSSCCCRWTPTPRRGGCGRGSGSARRAAGVVSRTASGAPGGSARPTWPSARRASSRSKTGGGGTTRSAASCARPRSPWPTRSRARLTWPAPRTRASRRCWSGARALVMPDDGPGAAALRRPAAEDLFR